jgi:uncharacterized protein
LLIRRSDRALLISALGFVAGFVILFATVSYDVNWDWTTMEYHGLWTGRGLVRSLFYDGFRSVFPWTGLLLFGMWLGRLDWAGANIPRRAMAWGLASIVTSCVASALLVNWFQAHPQPGMDHEAVAALFGLASMPPLPLFLMNAGGFALLVIGAGVLAARRWQGSAAVRALSATGRLALTWYVAHIVLGLGGVIVLGWTGVSHLRALGTATAFFAGAVAFSSFWSRNFRLGPLEALFRKAAGG